MRRKLAIILVLLFSGAAVLGQRWWRQQRFENVDNPREIEQHGAETPNWTNTQGFERDTVTFVRIRRDRASYRPGGAWWTDTPDSDLNLSYRLQQMTSMKVNPNGLFMRLTNKDVKNFPFIYMVEPGTLSLNEEEVGALREFLLNGGFLWVDDFWGEDEWEGMSGEIRKVFPNREWVELPLTNQLYHCVFDITSKGQVPNVDLGTRSQFDPQHVTWEKPDAKVVHHRAILDDKGRIMVFATHNTDNGDGWEWEGDNLFFFREFSEKISYPLAINVLFYIMTH